MTGFAREGRVVEIVIPGGTCVLHILMRPEATAAHRATAERIVTLMYSIADFYAAETA